MKEPTVPTVLYMPLDVRPEPWSTNQDRRINPYDRAERIALWKQAAFLAFRQYRVREGITGYLPYSTVRLTIPFDTVRVRDPHNYCGTVVKAVIDGLKQAKAWPDDSAEYVQHLEPRLVVDPDQRPDIEIILHAPFPR